MIPAALTGLEERVMDLRSAGLSYRRISEQLRTEWGSAYGFGPAQISKTLRRAEQRMAYRPTDDLSPQEIARRIGA